MGTNYYFRKKSVDLPRLHSIIASLNAEYKALIAKYNETLAVARSEMGLECGSEFDHRHDLVLLDRHDDIGDIHVGKTSGGWKPLMQASDHFHSIETLKQWYEQNKSEYIFINEYDEVIPFEEYLLKIHEWN